MEIKTAITKLMNDQALSFEETAAVMDAIMSGQVSDVQLASFLTALPSQRLTAAELAGAATAMRAHAQPFTTTQPVLEIVGTGGDFANTFNISTTAALVVAAAGVPVAKHGNRAASSKSGAADVLEALGVQLAVGPQRGQAILAEVGLAFLFAQEYHRAMRYVAPVRRELGIKTIFNYLGPLTNPAHAKRQLLGVADQAMMSPLATALTQLGVTDAMVVHGSDGLDEATLTGPTQVLMLRQGHQTRLEITPEQAGLQRVAASALTGGTPAENAAITRAILAGQPGPKRDVVLLNAGLSLMVAEPALTLEQAVKRAAQAIDSGQAAAKLAALVAASRQGGAA